MKTLLTYIIFVSSLFFLSSISSTVKASSGVDINFDRYNAFSGYDTHAKFAEDYTFDGAGNEYQLRSVYRSGASAETADLNPGSGTHNFTLQAKYNMFVTKYSPTGEYVTSYYIAYSALASNSAGALLPKIEVTDEGMFIYGNIYPSPFTVYTNTNLSSTTSITAGQTGTNAVNLLVRYDENMNYIGAYGTDGIEINDIVPNPNGGFYASMILQGTVDLDFMTSGTSSYSLANSPRTDGILASYRDNGSLVYVYKYNSVSSAAGSDVEVGRLEVNNDKVYSLLQFNSNTTPTEVDLDPTSGEQLRDLHEHDVAIIVFDHNGEYQWSHAVTSSDLYGAYDYVDDENVDSFDIGQDGSVYVGLYSDSDAVKIGSTTYEKGITGLANNNKYEAFIYKINPNGTTAWSKYFPSVNTTSVRVIDTLVDPLSDRTFFTLLVAASGSVTIDGTTYSNSSYSIDRYLFVQVNNSSGTVENAKYMNLSGTAADHTWENMSLNAMRSYTNPSSNVTKLMFQIDVESANNTANIVTLGNETSSYTLNDWTYFQEYYLLTPVNSSTSTSPVSSGCGLQPPGIKAPWIYGGIANSPTSVKLYISPGDGPFDNYTFKYDTVSGGSRWGITAVPFNNQWTWDINALSPNTTYYFSVRSGNGCATGNWSNEFKVKTSGSGSIQSVVPNSSSLDLQTPSSETASTATPKPSATPISIPELSIGGYDVNISVVDSSNKPIPGARVSLYSIPRESITDENGQAKFTGVEEGEHKLVVAYEGYEGEQSVNISGEAKEHNVTITIEVQNNLNPMLIVIISILGFTTLILLLLVIKKRNNK